MIRITNWRGNLSATSILKRIDKFEILQTTCSNERENGFSGLEIKIPISCSYHPSFKSYYRRPTSISLACPYKILDIVFRLRFWHCSTLDYT